MFIYHFSIVNSSRPFTITVRLSCTILNVSQQKGESVMVVPTLSEEEAKQCFPKGVFTKELPSGKKYLRYTPQP